MINLDTESHLSLLSQSPFSKIYETDQFQDGIGFFEAGQKILGLFDLDNTVMSYRHTLGTDHWFDFDYREFISQGLDGQEALETVLDKYLSLVPQIHEDDVYAVEPETPAIIRTLQAEGIDCLALTSRGVYLQKETLSQLGLFDIDFNKGHFADQQKTLSLGKESVLYNGMILAGGKNKGDCLLECLDYIPDKIIMYDDKLSNLQKVQTAIEKFNHEQLKIDPNFKPIEFIGIRYSRLDKLIHNVDPKVVELQKTYFNRVLSDQDAKAILKSRLKKDRKHYVDMEYDSLNQTLTLYSHKAYIYNLLKDILPDIENHRQLGQIRNINGKDRQTWSFAYQGKDAKRAFNKLSQHGLIENSTHQKLQGHFSQKLMVTQYNLRKHRAKGYDPKSDRAIYSDTKTTKIQNRYL